MFDLKKIALCALAVSAVILGTAEVYAADEPKITIGSVTQTKPGEVISIDINVENTPAMYGFNLKIGFDNKYLAPDTVTKGDNFKKFSVMSNTAETDANKSHLTQVIINGDAVDPVTANGKLCTITFKVKDAAKTGTTTLKIDDLLLIDEELEDIAAQTANGSVVIVDGAKVGDMNMDGEIGDDDAKELLRAVSSITDAEELVDHGNADADDNGFDILDVINILSSKGKQ